MDTRSHPRMRVSICFLAVLLLGACGETGTESPAIPETIIPVLEQTDTPTATATVTIPPSDTPAPSPVPSDTPVPPPCTPDLTFITDVTIQDNSVVAPGSVMDKQWSVQNSGTCDWDGTYRLRLISGPDLGVQDQALYPARAGTQAVIQMSLTAPLDAGWYTSTWQAMAPDGAGFGQVITISIVVQQP